MNALNSKKNIDPFSTMLHSMGWTKIDDTDDETDPDEMGDCRVVTFEKITEDGKRKLDIQLWEDGEHRITHWHHTDFSQFGCQSTTPIAFRTIEEMLEAIQTETNTEYDYS